MATSTNHVTQAQQQQQQQQQQDTLEAQVPPALSLASLGNRILRAFTFGLQEPDSDILEQWLQTSDPSQKDFLRDYKKLKQAPGNNIIESLARYHVFSTHAPPHPGRDSAATESAQTSIITVSQALDEFSHKLRADSGPSLRICVLSMKLPDSLHSVLFKFKDNLFRTTEKLNARCDMPSRSILHLIQKECGHSKTWIQHSLVRNISHAHRPHVLPSKAKPSRRIHLLHEKSNSSTFELTFVSGAPPYHSDFYEYTWQRQTQHPPVEHVVFHTSERGSDGSRSVLISIDSDREYFKGEGCAKILRAFSDRLTSVLPIPLSDQSPCSMESAYLGALFTVLIILAEITNDFVNSVNQITASLRYRGRSHPSGSKHHYLSHLDDNRRIAVCSVEDALELIAEIEDPVGRCSDARVLRVKLWDIKRDLEYLKDQLRALETEISTLQAMLREKMELRQLRRTYILTVLAAIYLPFALMTSFYGMNLSDPLWPTKNETTRTALSRTSTRDVPPILNKASLSSTEEINAIVHAIRTSGSHLWTLQAYWYVTMPVTIATIIVPMMPMIIGIIFRSVSRFAFRHRGYWRLLVVTGIAIIVVMLDIVTNLYGIQIIAMFVVTGVLGFTACVLVYISLVKKKHRLRWCGFAISVAIYPILLIYAFGLAANVLYIFIPFIYFLLVWFREEIIVVLKKLTKQFRSALQ